MRWITRSGSANVGRLREASRQNPAPGTKLAVVRIQADCLAAYPRLRCQCSLAFGCAELHEAHQKPVRFLSSAHPTAS
nr:hypothetical protein [Methylomarinum sp. Ch1-1]MDP4522004.1 hypothetical protein [Methylomarinum sp. Ch1-1]